MRTFKDLTKEEKVSQGVYAVHIVDCDINYVVVGSGFLGTRMSGNASKLRRGVHDNSRLQNLYNKEGTKCFVEALDTLLETKEYARELESKYVNYMKSLDGVVVLNDDSKLYVEKDFKQILKPDDVREIRKLIAEDKLTQKAIGNLYGVGAAQIHRIKIGKAHKKVI